MPRTSESQASSVIWNVHGTIAWYIIERKLVFLSLSLFSWCISPQGWGGGLHIYIYQSPWFLGVFSINLLNMFSSPGFSLVKRNCLLVAGRPVVLSQSFILAALSRVSMWLEYCCCVVTYSLSFSSPKLAKQLPAQQRELRTKEEKSECERLMLRGSEKTAILMVKVLHVFFTPVNHFHSFCY